MRTIATDCDILIVGAGLAGLALAMQLCHTRHAHLRITVIEQRSQYVRDRTWSYWRKAPHCYSPLERAHWSAWRVAFAGRSVLAKADGWQYASIDADAFYKTALAQIQACSHVTLQLGVQVQAVRVGQAPSALLANGETIRAQWIFDARPPSQAARGLAQHFVGWEISTEQSCFEPDTLDLMDFQAHSGAGLHFVYVLPYSGSRALVESTWVSDSDVRPNYAQELAQYIAKRWPDAIYKVVFEERGYLPLEHAAPVAAMDTKVLCIGRAGGTLRASTGFAFLDTIAHAECLAKAIAAAPSLQALSAPNLQFKRHAVDAWMDSVLVVALRRNWPRAPEFFMRMFAQAPTRELLLFLSGGSQWRVRLAVALSLPKWPFLSAAWWQLKAKAP